MAKPMNFEEFKDKVIAEGEQHGGTANPLAKGVMKFMYNTYLTEGVAYCPCQQERSNDTICPCVKYRAGNGCCCGLFLPK